MAARPDGCERDLGRFRPVRAAAPVVAGHDAQWGAAWLPVGVRAPEIELRSRGCTDRRRPRPGWPRRHVPARRLPWRRASRALRAIASGCSCARHRTCGPMTYASTRSSATRPRSDRARRTTSATNPCGRMTSWLTTSGRRTSGHSCGWIHRACRRTSATMNPSGTNRRSSSVHPTSVNHRYASLHVTTSSVTP